jgi:TM2 domain-containing membrane protein YozV
MNLLYIGPGMGIGSIILVLLISGIVLFAFGYIVYSKVKNFLKKKK